MKKSILLALLLFLGNSGLRAADFWKERDYKQWKPKEAHKMLTKSPWARNVSLDPMRMRRGDSGTLKAVPRRIRRPGAAIRTSLGAVSKPWLSILTPSP